MKTEESAGCDQIFSSWVGLGGDYQKSWFKTTAIAIFLDPHGC